MSISSPSVTQHMRCEMCSLKATAGTTATAETATEAATKTATASTEATAHNNRTAARASVGVVIDLVAPHNVTALIALKSHLIDRMEGIFLHHQALHGAHQSTLFALGAVAIEVEQKYNKHNKK